MYLLYGSDVFGMRNRVQEKKGKGEKYKHSVEVHYKVEDANIDGLLEKATDEDWNDQLVAFANSDTISLLARAADYDVINIQWIDVIHGLIVLLGMY